MQEKNYYKEIEDAFRKKREMREAERAARLLQLHESVPETVDIDLRLSQTGFLIMAALREGGDITAKTNAIKAENDEIRKKRGELLIKNGYPADYTDVKYDCEKCADSGFIELDMCECMINAIAEARLADSELGRLASSQSFENFELSYYPEGKDREAVALIHDRLKSFAEGFNSRSDQNWLLMGGTGLGKTHLSTAMGVAVIRRGYDVEYKTVQTVMDDFQQVQFRGGDARGIEKYYNCDLLIVDDLGAEMSTQFTVSCIYNLINTRMNKRKPTVFSTNLSANEIRERYSDRIASRLFGEYIPLMFRGTDIRHQRIGRKRGKV